MAILLGEAEAARCADVLEAQDEILISAGTMAEALIVALGRNCRDEMEKLIVGLGIEIIGVTAATVQNVVRAIRDMG